MFSPLLIIAIALGYVAVLFFLAWWGDRRARRQGSWVSHPVIYSLSLAVYCTSWTFYGAVGQAARTGWDFLPVYLGPLLTFAVFGGLIVRIVRVSKEQNVTSISDFLASRFGKTQRLAVLVTLVAVLGVVPYIALQLKGIAMGFDLLTQPAGSGMGLDAPLPIWQDTALMVALLLALFTILFGTRQLDATEHHPGLMLAVAFESIVKLVAFLLVGVFVTWFMFDGLASVDPFRVDSAQVEAMFAPDNLRLSFLTILVLSTLAAFCLPRQFHVAVVESTSEKDVRLARWLFPAYLVAIAIFIVPVAVAGLLTFGDSVEADTFMLSLPMHADQEWLTLLAMLGGFSAATGMVIVAAVALSIMVSNDIVMPALLRGPLTGRAPDADLGRLLLIIRRVVIVCILLLAWVYYRLFGFAESLAGIGLLSFAAVAQFGPLMIAAVFWRGANRRGALTGLGIGFGLWFYTLLLPVILQTTESGLGLLVDGPFGMQWLRPEAMFGLGIEDSLTHGVFVSLLGNLLGLWLGSLSGGERSIDRIQANAFLGAASAPGSDSLPRTGIATVGDFINLTRRFLGERRTRQTFDDYAQRNGQRLAESEPADAELVRHTERVLSGVIGASSARLVLSSALAGSGMRFDEVVSLLDQTSQKLKFRQELLQSAMENLSEGISVVDGELRLVAWNRSYLDMFDYPDGLIHIGRPIREVLEFNARRGRMGEGEVDELVERRMEWLRQRSPHFFERVGTDGRVIEIRGNPMPGGGFVTSFTDVTERKRTEQALRESERRLTEAKADLEARVIERTRALTELNEELKREVEVRARMEEALRLAKREADEANQSKTRFLAAASHDLLQPLNAARLFSSALEQQPALDEASAHLMERLSGSLTSAEELLSALLDISRLDAGAMPTNVREFALREVLEPLHAEFSAIARERGLRFDCVGCSARVVSDPKLLRRVLQNFLSNALRYTDEGRVLLGCRRQDGLLVIQVWDTGPGIPEDQRDVVFREFHRLQEGRRQGERGLGLGLAIVERIARMLDHPITLRSSEGRGTMFAISVPLGEGDSTSEPRRLPPRSGRRDLSGLRLLCIDNEPDILAGMSSLLEPWGCQVAVARNEDEVLAVIRGLEAPPQVMLADYHLDDEKNGIDLMNRLRAHYDEALPGILITADQTETVRLEARAQGYRVLNKPLRPAALRALLTRLSNRPVRRAP
ncbi:PAS domain-containing hybrid sensor histidine kinase/response regulator [Wenzhouxiangella marina]|uniref:histidine kinase n=1 Tax=Wenzhouxiangella marina TaxID=1579979 RepID=A0A0K0XZ15_9GAMM|nr:PAS domain-containing hybrid sensor histidine kinase/response regulator [Wenzhouxiangella marina]AKS42872.1 histidine kinase [Wenzhouxiangella marina]MBB6087446.1 PAS domain S-box-containing protein [Wenzhouxiangella marina]